MPLLLFPLPEKTKPPSRDETPPRRLKRHRSSHRAFCRLVVGESHAPGPLPVVHIVCTMHEGGNDGHIGFTVR